MTTIDREPTSDITALERLPETDPINDPPNPTCATTGVGPGPIYTGPPDV
jgi:hypothetical protein